MDEILPLVENAEGDETLAQDDDYNHASNNSSVEHDLEQPENNSDEIRNDGNLEHNVDPRMQGALDAQHTQGRRGARRHT